MTYTAAGGNSYLTSGSTLTLPGICQGQSVAALHLPRLHQLLLQLCQLAQPLADVAVQLRTLILPALPWLMTSSSSADAASHQQQNQQQEALCHVLPASCESLARKAAAAASELVQDLSRALAAASSGCSRSQAAAGTSSAKGTKSAPVPVDHGGKRCVSEGVALQQQESAALLLRVQQRWQLLWFKNQVLQDQCGSLASCTAEQAKLVGGLVHRVTEALSEAADAADNCHSVKQRRDAALQLLLQLQRAALLMRQQKHAQADSSPGGSSSHWGVPAGSAAPTEGGMSSCSAASVHRGVATLLEQQWQVLADTAEVPGSITQHLRSYQVAGVRFLFGLYSAGHGGVLNDDMGLGKTVQVHKLKNASSKQYEAAAGITTPYRFGLTGTVMPNRMEEMWAVLDLLAPGHLGDKTGFNEYYAKPIRRGRSSTAKKWEIQRGKERLEELKPLVRRLALRRTKAIISDQLPKKTDVVVFCQLKDLQRRAYERTLQSPDLKFDFEVALAGLVLGEDAAALGGLVAHSDGWLGASDTAHCGKMAVLQLLLASWAADRSASHKVLIFSHITRCLDLLEAFVGRSGYDYLRLDGSTPQKARQQLCDEFNTRPSLFIFLMSTVAGGLGLNLTAANKVAQDRAFRIGQARDVSVYRLLATGERQIYKQQQANTVLEGAQEERYFEGVQLAVEFSGSARLRLLVALEGHAGRMKGVGVVWVWM
eukprot:gene7621-7823_t